MNITPRQLEAILGGEAVSITLDETPCVVVRQDVFTRMTEGTYDDVDFDAREMARFLAELAPEDWEDASNYKERR